VTPEGYWARIKNVPLIPERESTDGTAVICRTTDGMPVYVTKPDKFSPEEREAMVRNYEARYSPHYNS